MSQDQDVFKVTFSSAAEDLSKIAEELQTKNAKLSMLFVSNTAKFESYTEEQLNQLGPNVIACSTAGEITPEGFSEDTIVGLSLHGDDFLSDTVSFENIGDTSSLDIKSLKEQFDSIKENHQRRLPGSKMFCLLLIDGLSTREEVITGIIANCMDGTPLVGGSAGDGFDFTKTRVFHKGRFQSNLATLTFVSTTRPFEVFKVQHFSGTEKKVVITDSDPEKRVVMEMDGMPAAVSYAQNLGIEVKDCTQTTFAKHPLMLQVGDEYYVRSIQKVNEDNSLSFHCAIDDGLVLTLAHRGNLVDNARTLFSQMKDKVGEIDQCILFECVFRQLEAKDLPEEEKGKLIEIYKNNKAIGFHTYGEQYGGLHINQTLTGVVFGKPRTAA